MHFGPFTLDERTWSLTRDGSTVALSPRLVELLEYFAKRPGIVVTKSELLEHFWPDVHVTENTLTRAIADIRKAIGDDASEPRFVQTVARRGYRFIGDGSSDSGDVFAAWVKGRLALDSLALPQLEGAVAIFEQAARQLPTYAPAHAALANAYLLQCEATRSTNTLNRDLLTQALLTAKRACTLDPRLGEGWAVLGHLLFAAGQTEAGKAAARRATVLEPDNWRHHYRLATTTWGEERLRAVDRASTLMPGFGPAYLLSAMVFVARNALDRAERAATAGADVQRQCGQDPMPLPAAGLHWLRGLVLHARGDRTAALASFDEEIANRASGHIYARECAVNAWIAVGFIRLTEGDARAAHSAFRLALNDSPRHPRASLGLGAALTRMKNLPEGEVMRHVSEEAVAELIRADRRDEAALVIAGREILNGRPDEALGGLDRLLGSAPPGQIGWMIPIDPMLAALRHTPGHTALVAKLAARAA